MTLPIGVRAGMVDQLISIMISIMINNFLKMKCYLFNDPFNKYGQETAVGNKCRGHEKMKYDTFLLSYQPTIRELPLAGLEPRIFALRATIANPTPLYIGL